MTIQLYSIPPLFPYTTLFRSPTLSLLFSSSAPSNALAKLARSSSESLNLSSASLRRCSVRRSEEHTSELQSRRKLVCRQLREKKNIIKNDEVIAIVLFLSNHL